MDNQKNIKELIKQCQDETHRLTEQLQNEKVLEFTDYSIDDLKIVDFSEGFNLLDEDLNTARNDVSNEEVKPDKITATNDDHAPSNVNTQELKVQAVSVSDESTDTDEAKVIYQLKAEEEKELNDLEKELDAAAIDENVTPIQDFEDRPVIIDFDNVTMRYNKIDKLIEGLNLKIHEGEFIYLVGASGAGKSTLSRLIYRDVNNIGGTVWVDGINATQLKPKNLHKLRKKVGVIFQDYKLLPNLTIYENVRYTLDVTGYPNNKKEEQVLKTLEKVGIKDQKDKYPNELSGGQQQRAAIARAIVNEPKIIVADEPTGNLDVKNADIIMKILERIHKAGTTVIMATHDIKIVNKYKHRTIKIEAGGIKGENKQGGYIYE